MTPLDPITVALRGTTLIEASAGTGKTYTITTLYVRLLLEHALPVSEILVVTYTNAATAELRARIRRRVRAALAALESNGQSRDETLDRLVQQSRTRGTIDADRRALGAALRGFDEAAIFTIHGFCQRMLQENAFESGVPFDTQLVTEQAPLRDEVVRDFWAREVYAAPEPFVRYLQQEGVTPTTLAQLAQKVVAHPEMPVLPAAVAAGDDAALNTWHGAHQQAAAIWVETHDEIIALLCASTALNRGTYRKESIRSQWSAQMDAELRAARPGISRRFPKFEKFTTSALVAGTKKNCRAPTHRFFVACDALLAADVALQQIFRNRLLQLQLDLVRYARREMPRRKELARTQSFDDLLHRLNDALSESGGAALTARIRARFRAALIDEFQDTDPVQYDIFRRLYHDNEGILFLIGDPKQAIYAFRGADVFAYMDAKRDAGGRAYTLTTNRRSDPRLVNAVNALFGRARAQFIFDGIPFLPMQAARSEDMLGGSLAGTAPLQILFVEPRDGKPVINKTSGTEVVTQAIAAEIVRLLQAGGTIRRAQSEAAIAPGDIAVLCRTNAQAAQMQDALRTLCVPSVLHSDASVFDALEAAELERVLRAIADPRDASLLRAALATTLIGVSGNELVALQTNEHDWEVWVQRFHAWHALWRQRGFVAAFRRMLDEHGVQRRVLACTDGERRMTNLLHLGELLQTALTEVQRGPLALVEWLSQMRRDETARADLGAEAAQIRLESDARAVQLVTVHKSKGLEYPIVFCPFLWDGMLLHEADKRLIRFHDRGHGNRLTLDIGSPDHAAHLAAATQEALAENLRLLYVALTRAQHRCTIVWGPFSDAKTSPLGYLLHQPPTGAVGEQLAQATASRIALLDADGMRKDLDQLVAAADGAIEVADLSFVPTSAYDTHEADDGTLRCHAVQRPLHAGWRTSSFSGLAAYGGVSRSAEEGLDHDETADDPALTIPPAQPVARTPVLLHDFPAGVRSGVLLHEIFQYLDFQNVDPAELQVLLAAKLRRNGFEAKWAEPLCRAVVSVLDTPLDAHVRLRDVPLGQRLNELEFVFPVGGDAAAGWLTRARLADVFVQRGAPPLPRDYAAQVHRLGFTPLAGYLRGFIDLVFQHGSRWYVVDYKSNLLGPRPEDYRPARLVDVMAQHHYFLQYHLYAVALHRHLTARLRGYDYDQHFGGVYYLFLRGMSPQHSPGCGVFHDRPGRTLIEGLSTVLAQPAGEAEAR